MIILFEEYHYKTQKLSEVISERYFLPVNDIYSKTNYVGYYFNSELNNGKGSCVIILPKVFVNKDGYAFEHFKPEDFIDPFSDGLEKLKAFDKNDLIFELTTWIYRAIQEFNKRKKKNSISEIQSINQVITNIGESENSELDIVLSLLKFHKENKELITFTFKNSHSQRNKINWRQTISKVKPFIINNKPIYFDFISTNKKRNEDEEILIIFYSVLNFLKDRYSFEIQIPDGFTLLRGNQMSRLLRNGLSILKKIKYKYFSDELIALYELLSAFFERSRKTQSQHKIEEILLVKDFNILFEDMIDELIGDENVMTHLKNHHDGKQVDHIYRDTSLFHSDDIYIVGDSKYYKPETNLSKLSVAKQFTYAKNVIQYNIDLFRLGQLEDNIRYRDDVTEGYNITPNFFIYGVIEDDYKFGFSHLKEVSNPFMQSQFENRLFDRDTLFIQSYSINFLFVLSAYVSKNTFLKEKFKKHSRAAFRVRFINYLNSRYKFFKITPKNKNFIEKFYRLLIGKIYRPSAFGDEYVLALELDSDIESLILKIEEHLTEIVEYQLEGNLPTKPELTP